MDIKRNSKLGKYRILNRIAEGGFANVYRAIDTIQNVRVALKIPHPRLLSESAMEGFRKEARIAAGLDHPNILSIKTADRVEELFVIVYPLGEGSLAERLNKKMSARNALALAEQMLEALAYAHMRRIVHCDIKPENFILFQDNRIRLADFGIARVARQSLHGSGSGTIGHMAPEQALGKPSLRSDVFSLGLVLYRMFAGALPEWPFDWPPPGFEKLKSKAHPDLIALIRRSLEVDQRKRFADADKMLAAFRRLKPRALAFSRGAQNSHYRRRRRDTPSSTWKTVRRKDFTRLFGRALETRLHCGGCGGPISEAMRACPWCGAAHGKLRGETGFPCRCPRCRRGMKSDWRFCPWCYGAAIGPSSPRNYPDKRYQAKCARPGCRKDLMPFMRYCPWCNRKVNRAWRVPDSKARCPSCGWGVAGEFWKHCPWCGKSLPH